MRRTADVINERKEEYRGARYNWLKFAALYAEEQGL